MFRYRIGDKKVPGMAYPSMDNRAGCAVLIELLRDMDTQNEVAVVFTTHEQVGLRGAKAAAFELDPDMGVALDVTPTRDIHKGVRHSVVLGQESTVKIMYSSLICSMGLRDRYVRLLEEIARRVGAHPSVMALDIMNEPHPGGVAEDVVAQLIAGYADAQALRGEMTSPEQVAALFADPSARMGMIDSLRDTALYRHMTDAVHALDSFEAGALSDLYARVSDAVRKICPDAIILRENSYFGNIGVACRARRLAAPFAFSPHGYDWVVDTPAVADASDERVDFIFARHKMTQQALDAPVLVGEWGGMGGYDGTRHERHIIGLFEKNLWSHTYWCWFDGFESAFSASSLRRTYPVAVVGELVRYQNDFDHAAFECEWRETLDGASEFFVAQSPRRITLDGRDVPLKLSGRQLNRLIIPAVGGMRKLKIEL